LIKNGKGLGPDGRPLGKGVTGTHGVTLATKIFDDGYDTTLPAWKERIYIGIACHMGIWTTNPEYKPSSITNSVHKAFAQLIHLADYCASRKVNDIYYKLETEITYDFIKESTGTKEIVSKSPACPGIRKTESRQTTAAENGK
jgi:hypothetical protein